MMKKLILATALFAAMSTSAFAESNVAADIGSVSASNAGSLSDPVAFRGTFGWGGNEIFKNEVSVLMTTDMTYGDAFGDIAIGNSSFSYAGVGTFPIAALPGLKLSGKLGLGLNHSFASGSGSYSTLSGLSASTFSLQYGLGAGYEINKNVSVHANWESLGEFKADSAASGADLSMLSAGASYKF